MILGAILRLPIDYAKYMSRFIAADDISHTHAASLRHSTATALTIR
jgi:hypothetical protein